MANETTTVVLRGKTNYCKLLPDQLTLNYDKSGKQWTCDFYDFPVKEVKALGIGDRVKEKEGYLEGNPYLSFKQTELRRDGEPNKPVPVTDIIDNPWPEDKKIGNGSTVDLKFAVVDYGKGKFKGVYLRSMRVLDHVPFEGRKDFTPVAETDEFFLKAQEAEAAAKAKPQTILSELTPFDDSVPSFDEDDEAV